MSKQSVESLDRATLQPVVGLTNGLSNSDIERITVEAIRKHRTLRDEAEALETTYVELPEQKEDSVGPARLAWIGAMIEMHAQQMVVSTLLNVLGYIPTVPSKSG